jgi:hypothetical protein
MYATPWQVRRMPLLLASMVDEIRLELRKHNQIGIDDKGEKMINDEDEDR